MPELLDEAQLEVSKNLVKFKTFKTKEEAEAFNEPGRVWSDVGEGKNGTYYRAWCRPGELAVEAVREAGEYYNLKVPLTAGYMIHRNWAGTH